MDGSNPACIGGSFVCLVLLGLFGIFSLGAVTPLHYGICYNSFTKAAQTDNVYVPGRYLIFPWNSFLLFPSDVQTIEFANEAGLAVSGIRYEPLHTRTKEGLGLHLQVSLQYRLRKEHLGKLYSEFNMNYAQVFISSLRDVLIKAASEYEAAQLWTERSQVGDVMQELVDKELRNMYAECWGLQLMVIDLPDLFENSIVHTQVQKQAVQTRRNQQISTQIRAETTVIKAEYDRRVKVLMAQGHANFTFTTKQAQAHAQQLRIDTESDILAKVKDKLHLDAEGLVLYQKYGALDDLDTASLFFGFGGNSQVMIQSSVAGR
jgi:regulator of protease activity HflC (stomatin/prohibitin superfamily)